MQLGGYDSKSAVPLQILSGQYEFLFMFTISFKDSQKKREPLNWKLDACLSQKKLQSV